MTEKKEAKKNVVLMEHPVSLDEKMDIRRQGYVIIDVRQKENVNPDRIVKTIMKPKDEDKDGLQDGTAKLEALRDECKAKGISFKGSQGADTLEKLLEEAK
jgi:hypothetical protein